MELNKTLSLLKSLRFLYKSSSHWVLSLIVSTSIAEIVDIKKSWVKDGAVVPGQVGLSWPSTLVRGSYPH